MDYSRILEEASFQEHKLFTVPILEKYQYFKPKKAKEMIECGSLLSFDVYQHKISLERQKKLSDMFTCKDRFCSFCNWRRSRKFSIQAYEILKHVESNYSVRYLFLTLTVKNPLLGELRSTIKAMNLAFKKFVKYKSISAFLLGYIKVLETHPQKDDFNFQHPHFHVLMVVSSSYFNSKYYLKHKDWQFFWRKALGVSYFPSVDVRVIKSKTVGVDPIASVVAETCKYPMKHKDISGLPVEIFEEFVFQMSRVRTISFGGLLSDVRHLLNQDDLEEGDLIYEGEYSDQVWEKVAEIRYRFYNGEFGLNYYLEIDNEK